MQSAYENTKRAGRVYHRAGRYSAASALSPS
jgi:hypothetical protein